MVEIKLTPEEEKMVLEVVRDKAKSEGISEEQALKDLLAIGVNSWREMQMLAKLIS